MDRHHQSPIERLTRTFLLGQEGLPGVWREAQQGLCLSGGADSCALAIVACAALEKAPDRFPGGIAAYHVRHGLRGSESEGDAASVRELCGRLGLALAELDAPIGPGSGLEARAREARYHRLRQAAGPGTLLVTAHHLEDQAETVMLRLLRGAGVVGLRGIHPLRSDGVWRPFLGASRQELSSVCRDIGWAPREDSSNIDTSFERNNLRHRLLPALEAESPGFSQALASLGSSAQHLGSHLESAIGRLESSLRFQLDPLGFSLDLSGYSATGPAEDDPELEILLDRAWSRCGRRPWAHEQRQRLLVDVASGRTGRRSGGQGELAIWGGRRLRVEKAG